MANEDVIIDNIPFEFAVPMLTGWSLQYATCGDQQAKEIGVWIDDWKFETPAQTGGGGRLSYRVSSNLRDKDSQPDFLSSHKVSVLGLRPLTGGGGTPIK